MKKVVIAGGAGFIGANLAREHLNRGDSVVVVDNFATGSKRNILELFENDRFQFIEADISEAPSRVLPHSADYVYHLASAASPPKYMAIPLETIWANTIGTQNLLDYSCAIGARMLFASTSEVYGDPLISPQSESYLGNVSTTGPRSVYDESKRLGETLLALSKRVKNSNVIIVRLFNTYGPFMDPYDGRVVTNFIRQMLLGEPLTIYGSGKQTRSFCYVEDTVRGLISAMESNEFGPINLGNPVERSLIDLAATISMVLGMDYSLEYQPLPQDDPIQRCPDITKAKERLHWVPSVGIERGITQTAEWLRQQIWL